MKNSKNDDAKFVIALEGLKISDNQKKELNKKLQKTVLNYLADADLDKQMVVQPKVNNQFILHNRFRLKIPFIWGIIIRDWDYNIADIQAEISQIDKFDNLQ